MTHPRVVFQFGKCQRFFWTWCSLEKGFFPFLRWTGPPTQSWAAWTSWSQPCQVGVTLSGQLDSEPYFSKFPTFLVLKHVHLSTWFSAFFLVSLFSIMSSIQLCYSSFLDEPSYSKVFFCNLLVSQVFYLYFIHLCTEHGVWEWLIKPRSFER